jgi:SnoaL-like domain
MRGIALAVAFVTVLAAPAFAQKAEIEAVNTKWMEFFNKGDFAGIASLYTADASAFPPGSPIVRGRDAIGAMWKGMAEKVSDPRVTTLEGQAAWSRRGARDRNVQLENQGSDAAGGDREVRRGMGEGRE